MTDTAFFDLLRSVDTPTVCNAIEVAQGQRGFDAFTRLGVHSLAPFLILTKERGQRDRQRIGQCRKGRK